MNLAEERGSRERGRQAPAMSALLEIVSELRDVRDQAVEELRRAILRASREGGHSGREIARAAGVSPQRISQLLKERRDEK